MIVIADCPCDCAMIADLDDTLARMLVRLEIRLGSPLFYTSRGRCEKHNKEVGGSPTSKHIIAPGTRQVLAVDVKSIMGDKTPDQIARAADELGFKGIGIYPGHVHLDNRPGPVARWPKELWE